MQGVRDPGDHESAGGARADEAARVLEDPRGVRRLFVRERCIGRVQKLDPLEPGVIVWDHAVALRLLQGESIPNVTGLMLVDGEHRPWWHPEPGVDAPVFSVG